MDCVLPLSTLIVGKYGALSTLCANFRGPFVHVNFSFLSKNIFKSLLSYILG